MQCNEEKEKKLYILLENVQKRIAELEAYLIILEGEITRLKKENESLAEESIKFSNYLTCLYERNRELNEQKTQL